MVEENLYWQVWGWLVFCVVVGYIGTLDWSRYWRDRYSMLSNGDGGYQRFVVVVRQAAPGQFGGAVSMKSVRRTDDWRVTWAESAGDAVNNVLGAGEVPVVWMRWNMLPVWKRAVLTLRGWLSILRGV